MHSDTVGQFRLQLTSDRRRGNSRFRPNESPDAASPGVDPVYGIANPAGSRHAGTSATIVSERRSVRSKTLLTPPLVLRRREKMSDQSCHWLSHWLSRQPYVSTSAMSLQERVLDVSPGAT